MGGCKCADDTAEWGPGVLVESHYHCYCPNNTYSSDDNLHCGIVKECVQSAVTQQRELWSAQEQTIARNREMAKVLNKKQLVKANEMNEMRHQRLFKTKQNRIRARVALGIVSKQYLRAKVDFVGGNLSKYTFQVAYKRATRAVASIRAQWISSQKLIDEKWENALAMLITTENFVDQDEQHLYDNYGAESKSLARKYSARITGIQQVPIVINATKAAADQSKEGTCPQY